MVNWRQGILYVLLVGMTSQAFTQKLTVGADLRYPVFSELETKEGRTLYFADDINSAYQVDSDHRLRSRSFAFPESYARYLFNDNVFVQYQIGYLSYLKTVNTLYKSSLHNNVKYTNSFDYSYLTNQLSVGYRFLRGKEMRFTLSGGIGQYYLLRFKEISRKDESLWLKNLVPYGQVIHQDYASISDQFFTYIFSGGLEYYILTVKVTYHQSFTNLNETGDFINAYRAFYISAGLNLLNFQVRNKKLIRINNNPDQ